MQCFTPHMHLQVNGAQISGFNNVLFRVILIGGKIRLLDVFCVYIASTYYIKHKKPTTTIGRKSGRSIIR